MSNVWKELHANYRHQDWIEKPSLFAEKAIQYFPKEGKILELGAGHGQDSLFFADQGYHVVSSDLDISALESNLSKYPEELRKKIQVQRLDLKEVLPFKDEAFDVVYAHLSLHYFDEKTTQIIICEIERILKPGGVCAFLTNSVNDPEYKTGERIEKDFFLIGQITKRYFSVETTRRLVRNFQVTLIDNFGQTYKDRAKGIHHLIRFIGHKPLEKFSMAIPYVGAIIERENNGNKEVLIQTRWKPHSDPLYTGTFEFPAGTLDKPYENIYETLAREIEEECGLQLKCVKGDSKTPIFHSDKKDSVFGFRPFCCTQQLKNGKPWIGFVFICEVENSTPEAQLDECKEIKWVQVEQMKKIFDVSPEKLFALELPAWEYYFISNGLKR